MINFTSGLETFMNSQISFRNSVISFTSTVMSFTSVTIFIVHVPDAEAQLTQADQENAADLD